MSIYEVHVVSIQEKIYYLTFGWGTQGAGLQYNIIQIFNISDNQLEKGSTCLPATFNPIIEYPRSEHSDLSFNPQTNTISYNEFKLDEGTGFYKRTGKTIGIKLEYSKF